MKRRKQTLWKYGWVQLPLKVGWPAWYCEDGLWKRTEKVLRVVEEETDHITFETEQYCYCFEFQRAESVMLELAA
ncbi:hypothetical protein [Parablautia sp. Marseille-Q6255]|uniref:hypothetical protein n=1 Tax=Parablautia sp. Marseille-Q6255 TaxID=3039593 RepID=UPI0024BC3F47|nr:hypothetical protein [Parablautia sp. Marseille-Q6255]